MYRSIDPNQYINVVCHAKHIMQVINEITLTISLG